MDASIATTLSSSRLVFGLVTVVGMALCSAGIGTAARLGLWGHPITIIGYVLGGLALLLAAQGLLRLWSAWFDGMAVRAMPDGATVLEGIVVDQAAPHGMLARIRDLGLPLVEVERVTVASS